LPYVAKVGLRTLAGQETRPSSDGGLHPARQPACAFAGCALSSGAQGLWYPTQNAEDKTFSDWGTPRVWWESVDRPGATQMGFLRKCYESVDWWKLAPRPDALEFAGKEKDATRPLVKSAGDAVHLVWFPKGSGAQTAASLRLTDAAGEGTYIATWFNLRDGTETKVVAPLAAAGGKCPLPARPDEEDCMPILR
jgi:hypothetical protein